MATPLTEKSDEKNRKNLQTKIYLAFFFLICEMLFPSGVMRFSFVSLQRNHTVQSNHDGGFLIKHDLIKTAMASPRTRRHATIKFEVVCFPGDQLPRYQQKTKCFKG